MKTSCPACGAVASLDVLIGHEGAREAMMIVLARDPLGKLLVQYLAMFRPAQRNLSFDRVTNLLNELLPMIQSAKITRNGRIWSAPQDYWKMALEEMIARRDKLTLPLKNHGYLLSIIEGYGNKAEAKREEQIEAQRAGHTPVGGHTRPVCQIGQVVVSDKPRSTMPASIKDILKKGKSDAPQ